MIEAHAVWTVDPCHVCGAALDGRNGHDPSGGVELHLWDDDCRGPTVLLCRPCSNGVVRELLARLIGVA
jgi:hypothetical protein